MMHATQMLLLAAVAALLPATINAQLCDTSAECCFVNNILVEQDGNGIVTVEGSLAGVCDTMYNKATLVCAANGLRCTSAQGTVTRSGDSLSLAPAATDSTINATCISGACRTNAAAFAGVYLVETTLGKDEAAARSRQQWDCSRVID